MHALRRLIGTFALVAALVGASCDAGGCPPIPEVDARPLVLPVTEVTADNLRAFEDDVFVEVHVRRPDGTPWEGHRVSYNLIDVDREVGRRVGGDWPTTVTGSDGVTRLTLAEIHDGTQRDRELLAARLNRYELFVAIAPFNKGLCAGASEDEAQIVLGG